MQFLRAFMCKSLSVIRKDLVEILRFYLNCSYIAAVNLKDSDPLKIYQPFIIELHCLFKLFCISYSFKDTNGKQSKWETLCATKCDLEWILSKKIMRPLYLCFTFCYPTTVYILACTVLPKCWVLCLSTSASPG